MNSYSVNHNQSIKYNTFLPPKKGRFSINILSNVTNFTLNIIIGLWLTPYLIQHLGVAVYGLVPLVVTMTSYLGLFTTALNSAVGRYITIASDQQDYAEVNRIFNTSFWGTVVVLMILLGPVLWLSTKAQYFFNIPTGYEAQFNVLLICAIGVFFLTTITSSFSIATYCYNRFDLANAINIAGTFIRLVIILLMFNIFTPKIWHIGLAMLVSTVTILVFSVNVWRRLMPTLRVERSAFSRQTYTRLTGMGGWIVINQIGSLLFLSIEIVIVNKILGAEAGGQYGAVMMWPSMLRSLAGVLAAVFGPTIITLYGRQDNRELVAYSRQAVKFVGLMIALPIGLICGFARPLLRLWLGPAFESLAPLMLLMSIHLCVNSAVLPLFNIPIAMNQVRMPGILTCIMGIVNLGLALLLAGPVGWGMYGVAGAGAFMLTAKNFVFTPIYGAHILGLKYTTFYREILPIIGITLLLSSVGWILAYNIKLNTWFMLGLTGIVLACMSMLAFYHLFMTEKEKIKMKNIMLVRSIN